MKLSRLAPGILPLARIPWAFLAAGLLASSALAQDECSYISDEEKQRYEDTASHFEILHWNTMWYCGEHIFSTSLPLGVATIKLTHPGTTDTVTAEIRQTKYENPLDPFELVNLSSSRSVASKAVGNYMGFSLGYTYDNWLGIYPIFKAWIDQHIGLGTVPPPFGEFEIRIYWNTKGWGAWEVRHVFQYYEAMHETEGFPGMGTSPGGGGGITPEDLEDQNVNKEGFWSSLFVPDEENLNLLRDKGMQLMSWGPFGLIGALNGKIQAYDASVEEIDGVLNVATPFGNQELDFRPYEVGIKMARWLLAGFMWLGFIMLLWKHIYAKV